MGEIVNLAQKRQEMRTREVEGSFQCILFLGQFVDTESYTVIKTAKTQLIFGNTYRKNLSRAEKLSLDEAIARLRTASPDFIKNHLTWYIALFDRIKNHCDATLK